MSTSNLAHDTGPTYLKFQQDGLKLYTGGTDSLVRIWRTDKEGLHMEPDIAHEADEAITSIAISHLGWLSGSLDGQVRQYGPGGAEMKELFTRTPGAAIRSIAFDPKGETVAVASDDPTIKIISFKDPNQVTLLKGHTHAIRKVSWHPHGGLLATSSADGCLLLWDTATAEVVHKLEGVVPPIIDSTVHEYSYDCSAVWHPSGDRFYIASKSHDIVSYLKEDWKKDATFSDSDSTGAVTALCVSGNGLYLAVATESKQILIYSITINKVLFRQTPDHVICCISFSPSENLLAWTCMDGTLVRLTNTISSDFPGPNQKVSERKPVSTISAKRDYDPFGDDDTVPAEYDEDWVIDDLGDGLRDEPTREIGGHYAKEMVSVTKSQGAFQPGSTPMRDGRRYLAFNSIGVIEVHDQDLHHVVNVDFHDLATRKSYHFQDTNKYEMASVGERGILFACNGGNGQPGRVEYKPYATWASTSEWSFNLPVGEDPIAVAAGGFPLTRVLRDIADEDIEGNGVAVVATSKGYIRFFTGGGLQKYIWYLGDDVVTMAAGREWLFIVHREGGTTLDGCQNLSYTLMALDTFVILQQGRLPLPKSRELKWIGITDEGAPLIYDSTGVLSLVDRFRQPTQARWIPLLDTNTLARKEGKDESYWPVGMTGNKFMCLILKGRETCPGFPRPLIQDLDVQMPMLEIDHPDTRFEEQFLRESLYVNALRDGLADQLQSEEVARKELALDKYLIQLIQLACKAGHLQKAVDSVLALHHKASFDGASKIAGFYQLAGLQEKISKVKDAYSRRDRREEERSSRQSWYRHAAPIAGLSMGESSSTGRLDASLNQPLQSGMRKPLRLAEASANTRTPSLELDPATVPMDHFWDETRLKSSTLGDSNKRKRSGNESETSITVTTYGSASIDPAPKRRVTASGDVDLDGTSSAQRLVSNPFLKKSAPKTGQGAFDGFGPTKSLLKSDSFFDKVEASGAEKSSKNPLAARKQKASSGGTQKTLFDLQSKKSSKANASQINTAQEANPSGPVEATGRGVSEEMWTDESQTQTPTVAESQVTAC